MSATDLPIRVGVGQFMNPCTEKLRYVKQPGVNGMLVNGMLVNRHRLELREQIE